MRTTRFFYAAICILQSLNLFAQAPQAIPYQGVARNSAGNILASQGISLRITIHEGNANGTVSFKEIDTVTTNNLGLFSVSIGNGIPVVGALSTVNWNSGNKFLQVEMDPSGGSSYFDMGTQQLMSVPYALFATSSGTSGDNRWTILGADIYNNNNGNVGIASTSPEFRLSLDNDGGILAKGTWNSGNILTTSGSGVRMFWYPRKAAFRAGEASGNCWDDANINYGSAAFGYATRATGSTSFAAGIGSVASGSSAVAFGDHATASGETSSAFGYYTTANGNHSFAAGNSDSAMGLASFAVGDGNKVTGNYSSAFGFANNASGNASLAAGFGSSADGDFSTAIGTLARNNNYEGSFVFGDASSLFGDNSYVSNTANNQFMVRASGGYIFYNDLALSASNSMVFNGGKLGIGITNPVSKLSVDGNIELNNNQLLLKTGGNLGSALRYDATTDGPALVGATGGYLGLYVNNKVLSWQSARVGINGGMAVGINYFANGTPPSNGAIVEGNVGIGTTNPVNKLDVEGKMAVGATYSGTTAAPVNGAIIEGSVGVGTTSPASKLDVEGGIAVGAAYSGTTAAPANGAIIEGNVGIGTTSPASKLDVEGGMAVGATYSGTTAAPTNGAIIEGVVGIGTNTPLAGVKLDVDGAIKVGVNGTAITNIYKASYGLSAITIPANTTTVQNYVVTNASTSSSVFASPSVALPVGVVIAYARVQATTNIEIAFRNTTGGPLTLTAGLIHITVIQ